MTPSPNQDPTTANSENGWLQECLVKLLQDHYNMSSPGKYTIMPEFSSPEFEEAKQTILSKLSEARKELVPGQISLCTKCNCMTKTVGRFASCGKCGTQKYFTQAEVRQIVAEARLDEQQRTGRLKYRAGDDDLMFFQHDGSTNITQEQRIEQLEAQLNPQKPGEGSRDA